MQVDPEDTTDIPAVVAMTKKVVLSIGGWNFPSAFFSKMVAS